MNFIGQYGQPLQNIGPSSMNPSTIRPKQDIKKFMHDFNDKSREHFNHYWFERNDNDIIEGMKQIILSCERDKYFILKVLGFDVITDYEEINRIMYNYYNRKTKKDKREDNEYDFIILKDSDVMLLRIRYYIKLNIPEDQIRINPRTKQPETTEGEVEVYIMLPRYVDKYYFRILGNYYSPIFQIVDSSTYNNTTSSSKKVQSVTLKTNFMPIKIYKESEELIDVVDQSVKKCTLFTSYIFSKKTDAMKFILGRYGYYGTLEFLELEGIYIQNGNNATPMDPNIFYNFYDSDHHVLLSVVKLLFDRDNVTQSFVSTILKSLHKLETFQDVFDPRYWTKSLGANFRSATLDKGIPVLDSFESIYDIRVRESIRLPIEDKKDSYCILRWLMREFNLLKNKDNIDISTKHPRMADEYLPALYAMKISKNLYRISDKGKNVTFKDVLRVIDIPPNYILKNIHTTNLVSYVDLVNDNDAELALSYTYKGISGLGNKGVSGPGNRGPNSGNQTSNSSVPIIYRSVHPSHLGKLDLDSSTTSDPGLSGIICPMAKIYTDSFTDYQEPNEWKNFYQETLLELRRLHHMKQALEFTKRLGLAYDYVKDQLVSETIEAYQKYIPILTNDDESQEEDDSDIIDVNDDDTVPFDVD